MKVTTTTLDGAISQVAATAGAVAVLLVESEDGLEVCIYRRGELVEQYLLSKTWND